MSKQRKKKLCVIILLCFVIIMMVSAWGLTTQEKSNNKQNKGPDAGLEVSENKMSMTQKRTIEVSFELPKEVNVNDLMWTYGGKALSEWKKMDLTTGEDGDAFITVSEIEVKKNRAYASVTFDLPYDTEDLADGPLFQTVPYVDMIGTFELAVADKNHVIAAAPIELLPYDSYCNYKMLKSKIEEITEQAGTDRYIETTTIGKSEAGRNIYFTVIAKDKKAVDNYENDILPSMMKEPGRLQQDIQNGSIDNYQIPIFINNIHPNESSGVSAIVELLRTIALEDKISYSDKNQKKIELDMNDVLDHVFFLLVYTDNPDGLDNMTRFNDNYFDLNRDNAAQIQPETQCVTEQIAKWCPITLLDLHGFDKGFLIEPCSPPHNPNVEYDLLMDNMLEQARNMGDAAITNTKYEQYYIPYEEFKKTVEDPSYKSDATQLNWDDASAAYTATFAMNLGTMGHTIEVPEMNEESINALLYCIKAAINYTITDKDRLFLNQLEIYRRGVENLDKTSVDAYLADDQNMVIGRERGDNQNFFPEYYVLPIDKELQKNPLEVYKMMEYFLRNGIEITQLTSDTTIADITYKAGTYVVDMHQAKRGLVNLVLYDGVDISNATYVTSAFVQDFPVLRGFDCYKVRVNGIFDNKLAAVTTVSIPPVVKQGESEYIIIRNTNNDAIKAVNQLLLENKCVEMVETSEESYKAGDFLVKTEDLEPLLNQYYIETEMCVDNIPKGKRLASSKVVAWGDAAYVLNKLGFEVTQNTDEGDIFINALDVEEEVKKGKPYIAFGNMGMNNIETLIPDFQFVGPEWQNYEGVFLANVNQTHTITAPYNSKEYFYSTMASYITRVPKSAEILMTISEDANFFKEGWWPGHDDARGQILAFSYQEEKKKIVVFANDLVNEARSQSQYRLLATAIYDLQVLSVEDEK